MARPELASKSQCLTIGHMTVSESVDFDRKKAHALFAQGDFAGAEMVCRRAVRSTPEDASLHYNLGVVLSQTGRFEEAIACYRKTIELNPAFAAAYTNIGFCLNAFNLIAQARE